jgi:hypothetical protein
VDVAQPGDSLVYCQHISDVNKRSSQQFNSRWQFPDFTIIDALELLLMCTFCMRFEFHAQFKICSTFNLNQWNVALQIVLSQNAFPAWGCINSIGIVAHLDRTDVTKNKKTLNTIHCLLCLAMRCVWLKSGKIKKKDGCG